MSVGERIRAARKAKGVTQKQLSEILGTTQGTVNQWEKGKRNPKLNPTLRKIAKALDVEVFSLYEPLPGRLDNLQYFEWLTQFDPPPLIVGGPGMLDDWTEEDRSAIAEYTNLPDKYRSMIRFMIRATLREYIEEIKGGKVNG